MSELDCFRAPLSEGEEQRRLAAGLSARQRELLNRWGYPYVFDQFRFHMTLTGKLAPERRPTWLAALRAAFCELAQPDLVIDAVALAWQPDRNAAFRVIQRASLRR